MGSSNKRKSAVEKKMRKAWELLKDRQKKISTIAKELGYSSGSHFTFGFKQFYGITPSAVRKIQSRDQSFDEKIKWLSKKEILRLRDEWSVKGINHNNKTN